MKRIRFSLSFLLFLLAGVGGLRGGDGGGGQSAPLVIDDAAPLEGTLTGDWGGLRSELAANGIVLDLSYTEYYAGVFGGGVSGDGFDFGGRVDALVRSDWEKLGLWEGGGFQVHLESRSGEAAERAFPRSGGLWPPNTGVVLPLGGSERLVASSLYFTQKLSDRTVLMLGKINAVDLLAGDPFFGGWARDRFTNIAFVAPPNGVVPPTIMGAVLSHRVDELSFTLMAFDPEDRTNDYWPNDLFDGGVNLSLGATWTGKVAERTSSLGLTGTYSTKEGADLSELLLPPDVRGGGEKGSWNVALSGSHLLCELPHASGKGLGLYFKAALADGNPNPIQSSVIGGLAGHGGGRTGPTMSSGSAVTLTNGATTSRPEWCPSSPSPTRPGSSASTISPLPPGSGSPPISSGSIRATPDSPTPGSEC